MKKHLKIFLLMIKTYLSEELSFRLNFLMELVGTFCFIGLYVAMIIFLMSRISFGSWTIKEMWILLGNFLIICYSIFYFFWRGMLHLVENIRNGSLDFYLTKPVDSQFFVSIHGGGVHNLLAIITGIIVLIWAILNLGINPSPLQIAFLVLTIIAGILDFYSLLLFLATLNFHFGYLGEASFQIFEFQNFSRYPMEAFKALPLGLLFLVIPFSALTSVPSMILINKIFPWTEVLIFLLASLFLIFAVRKYWFREINYYSSASS